MEFEADSPRPPEDERMVVFVGSAASLFEPTSLPMWRDFVRGVVNGLVTCAFNGTPNDDLTARLMGEKPYVVLDTIIRRLGSEYLHVMRSLDRRPSNDIHEFLAQGLIDGKFPALVTTNFDRCVEDLLERKGYTLCELHGHDAAEDIAALDKQAALNQKMNIVVCVSPLGFTMLKKTPSLMGRKDYAFILKVHGDCRHPETCVDTEAQRARGLPAQVIGVLSLILQRFPMMFVGWSGADLDENEDYVRLKSERDLAKIYWLLRPGEAEPSAFARLKAPLGDRFVIMRGSLKGKLPPKRDPALGPPPGSFEEGALQWAKTRIGAKWSRVVLADLARECKSWKDVELLLKLNSGAETDMAKAVRTSLKATQTNYLLFSRSSNAFAQRHATLVLRVMSSLDLLAKGKLDTAWSLARKAATAAVSNVLHGDLRFSDSWIPFALCALVLAHDPQSKELAELCFYDAESASVESGNHRAKRELEGFASLFVFSGEDKKQQDEAVKMENTSPLAKEDDPIEIFTLSFDNAARVTTGVPDSILMRAELYRASLCGNYAAIPAQFLLDSRPFVTEVIFSKTDDASMYDLLALIRPVLFDEVGVKKVNCMVDPHPIMTTRMEGYVNNPNLIYEEIPTEMIQLMDTYFTHNKQALCFFDAKKVANAYKTRSFALLDDLESIPSHFTSPQAAQDARTAFPIVSEFAKVTAPGETVLYRSLLYKFGDLFVKATSEDDLWNGFYPNVKEAVEKHYGSREALMAKRRVITSKPYRFCEVVKDASDAAYTTNLPLNKGFCFAADDRDLRPLQLISGALKKEADSVTKVDDSPINVGSFDALQLASLSMAKLKEIRNSKEATALRNAIRKARSAPDDAQYRVARASCEKAATALYELVKGHVLRPGQRKLPEKLSVKQSAGMDPKFVALRDAILNGLRPSLSEPPHALFDVPMVSFPGLVITRILPDKAS